ncbi:MAG: ABC transporter substrate-binding protein [Rhizobiales bacterium]|nr:ABC transporter substrate-binding protein [Hyphomicrobiales bacterium]
MPRWLAAGLAAGMVLVVGAADAADKVLSIVSPWEITSTDPSISGHVFAKLQIAETLIDADDHGRLRPGLATAWTGSDDLKSWRIAVREGVIFHDGSSLTAETVAHSLTVARSKTGVLEDLAIRDIRAEGSEVIIDLDKPFAALPAFLAQYSTQILAPASYDESGAVTEVIGSGPYEIVEIAPPQRLQAERFDGYWGETPAIDAVSYLAASRGETRALMVESGDADIAFTLDAASQARLAANDDLVIHELPIPRSTLLKANAGHAFLDSVAARQALSLAIDRAGIAAGILRAPEVAASQLLPPAIADWHVKDLEPLRTDPTEAVAMLEAEGWAKNGEGMLIRDGQPFTLTVRAFPDRPELPLIAAALQDQLRTVGITLEVAIGNASEIPAGHQDGSLELALFARNFGLLPDPLGTILLDYDRKGADWGVMNWRNETMQAILDALAGTADPEERRKLATTAVELLQSELPVIPIAWYQHTAAVGSRVTGFSLDPLERSYRLTDLAWAE